MYPQALIHIHAHMHMQARFMLQVFSSYWLSTHPFTVNMAQRDSRIYPQSPAMSLEQMIAGAAPCNDVTHVMLPCRWGK
jgi:hypothetical protein